MLQPPCNKWEIGDEKWGEGERAEEEEEEEEEEKRRKGWEGWVQFQVNRCFLFLFSFHLLLSIFLSIFLYFSHSISLTLSLSLSLSSSLSPSLSSLWWDFCSPKTTRRRSIPWPSASCTRWGITPYPFCNRFLFFFFLPLLFMYAIYAHTLHFILLFNTKRTCNVLLPLPNLFSFFLSPPLALLSSLKMHRMATSSKAEAAQRAMAEATEREREKEVSEREREREREREKEKREERELAGLLFPHFYFSSSFLSHSLPSLSYPLFLIFFSLSLSFFPFFGFLSSLFLSFFLSFFLFPSPPPFF